MHLLQHFLSLYFVFCLCILSLYFVFVFCLCILSLYLSLYIVWCEHADEDAGHCNRWQRNCPSAEAPPCTYTRSSSSINIFTITIPIVIAITIPINIFAITIPIVIAIANARMCVSACVFLTLQSKVTS